MDLETIRQSVRETSIRIHKAEFEANLDRLIRSRKSSYGVLPQSFKYLNVVRMPINFKF